MYRDSRGFHINNEHADSIIFSGGIGVSSGGKPAIVSIMGIASPDLIAIDYIFIVFLYSGGLQRGEVRTSVRLAVAEANYQITLRYTKSILLLLLFTSEE